MAVGLMQVKGKGLDLTEPGMAEILEPLRVNSVAASHRPIRIDLKNELFRSVNDIVGQR